MDVLSFRTEIRRLIECKWLLLKLTESEARNLFELIHKRRKKSSTIFCSQFRESEWYQQICSGESTLADAIMDRISYDSYKINIDEYSGLFYSTSPVTRQHDSGLTNSAAPVIVLR